MAAGLRFAALAFAAHALASATSLPGALAADDDTEALALLQHVALATPKAQPVGDVGGQAALSQAGYVSVVKSNSDAEMQAFIKRAVEKIGGVITNETRLVSFAPFYSGTILSQTYHRLLQELRQIAGDRSGWVRLPPPAAGVVLADMIRSDPWQCDMFPAFDPRRNSCVQNVTADDLNPRLLTCGRVAGKCSVENANSHRTNFAIGALPCCPTGAWCAAPACSGKAPGARSLLEQGATCTPRPPAENVEMLKREDMWPAYHGWGGSYELDTLKFVDLLSCRSGNCTEPPMDLVIDLGANTGYYTEKLTGRQFGKKYLLVEGNNLTARCLRERWGNKEWLQRWYTKQVTPSKGVPDFEVHSFALSNSSGETVNMCTTEFSFSLTEHGCLAEVITVDDIMARKLSPAFKEHVAQARDAFIKIDTEGMDELVLRGMEGLLSQRRGSYEDGTPRHLVNFLQFEFSPALTAIAKERGGFRAYDIKTATEYLESQGFETFIIGPNYLPLSHGSWHDDYINFIGDPENNAGVLTNYPKFDGRLCSWCEVDNTASFTADVFAMRRSHPRATEIKLALGACKESREFSLRDPQYSP